MQKYLDKLKEINKKQEENEKESERLEEQKAKLKKDFKKEYGELMEELSDDGGEIKSVDFPLEDRDYTFVHKFELEDDFIERTLRQGRLVKLCLDYCYHRLTKHKGTGLEGLVTIEELNKLRKELT